MLHDRTGRLLKIPDDLPRRVQIQDIVEGKLFAVKFFGFYNSGCHRGLLIQSPFLVRIFTVAQIR